MKGGRESQREVIEFSCMVSRGKVGHLLVPRHQPWPVWTTLLLLQHKEQPSVSLLVSRFLNNTHPSTAVPHTLSCNTGHTTTMPNPT